MMFIAANGAAFYFYIRNRRRSRLQFTTLRLILHSELNTLTQLETSKYMKPSMVPEVASSENSDSYHTVC